MTGHRGVLDILTKYCGKRMNFRGQMFIHAIQWAHFPVMDYLRETWDDFPEFGYRENLMRWVNIARSGGKQPVIDYLEDM